MNSSHNIIELGNVSLDVVRKDIKNVHLSVHPPLGRATIAAPIKMDMETIRLFGISKLSWIRKQQMKLRKQKRETARQYVTRESHYYLGKRYLLKVIEQDSAQRVVLKHSTIELHVRPGATKVQKKALLQGWYRKQLKEVVPQFISHLEKKMKVAVSEVCVRSMRTKWGTCNIEARRIWLNTELIKKPIESIEYVLTHEMVHLLERNHNDRFITYMDKFLPTWKYLREELNRSALGHVVWSD